MDWNDIKWDSIPEENLSMDWEMIKGLYITLWENKVGSPNNSIKWISYLPSSINKAISNYIDD